MTRAEDRGQAAVELALALPLVVLLLLAVVQVGLVVRDQVLTVHAAREAARAVAVDPSPGAGRAAALAGAGLEPRRVSVEVTRTDQSVAVVTYRSPTDLPIVGALIPDIGLRAKAAMRTER